jgi:hypothetical protein
MGFEITSNQSHLSNKFDPAEIPSKIFAFVLHNPSAENLVMFFYAG